MGLIGTIDREFVHAVRSMILHQIGGVRVSTASGVHCGILFLALVVVSTDIVPQVESKLLGDTSTVIEVLEYGSTSVIILLAFPFLATA